MSTDADLQTAFDQIADATQRVFDGLHVLQDKAGFLCPDPLEGQEWYELLRQKLVPQLGEQAFLVVAVVGGTNIGKSVIFNHLAGCKASASSPLASGTKHPVCLVPEGFTSQHDLKAAWLGGHEFKDGGFAQLVELATDP